MWFRRSAALSCAPAEIKSDNMLAALCEKHAIPGLIFELEGCTGASQRAPAAPDEVETIDLVQEWINETEAEA